MIIRNIDILWIFKKRSDRFLTKWAVTPSSTGMFLEGKKKVRHYLGNVFLALGTGWN